MYDPPIHCLTLKMSFNLKTVKSPILNTEIVVNARKHLDLYHTVLSLTWLRFNFLLILSFVLINLIFGLLYRLSPESIGGISNQSYLNYFFFSVQTLATIGYGNMYPQTMYGNILVTCEAIVGLFSFRFNCWYVCSNLHRINDRRYFK